jgi:hypothetical protein
MKLFIVLSVFVTGLLTRSPLDLAAAPSGARPGSPQSVARPSQYAVMRRSTGVVICPVTNKVTSKKRGGKSRKNDIKNEKPDRDEREK